ncbi:MAG: peptidase [Gammaproteobacteria bacterium]|jgi:dipeptidase|nr:peptidase [Gammaproteobacteria bacterium]
MMKKKFIAAATLSLLLVNSFACTTIIVGKKASADGSVLIARNDDGESPDWAIHFVLHPREGAYTFKSPDNDFTYRMPKINYAYTGMPDWNTKDKAMEEAGLNEFGIAMSATETIYASDKAAAADPYVTKTGITESAIPTVILPQIKSAKAGVELLGKIVETQGAGEGFGVIFADKNEAWYFENGAGHEWAAGRIPDEDYFISANQGRIAQLNLNDANNYLSSPNLISFATQHKLYNPAKDGEFNFSKAFARTSSQDTFYNHLRVWALQKLYTPSFHNDFKNGYFPVFLKPDHLLSVTDVESGLQNRYQGTENDPYMTQNPKATLRPISVLRAQESHVIQLRSSLPLPIANVQYIELGMTALGIYLPFYQGVTKLPHAYSIGTNQADDESAFWRFRKLQILAMLNYPKYAPLVQEAYAKLNIETQEEQKKVELQYLTLYKQKKMLQAQKLLNDFTAQTVTKAFTLTDRLSNQILTQQGNEISKIYQFSPEEDR